MIIHFIAFITISYDEYIFYVHKQNKSTDKLTYFYIIKSLHPPPEGRGFSLALDKNIFNETLAERLYYKDEKGDLKFLSHPWSGYFENLDSVQMKEMIISVPTVDKKKNLKL